MIQNSKTVLEQGSIQGKLLLTTTSGGGREKGLGGEHGTVSRT